VDLPTDSLAIFAAVVQQTRLRNEIQPAEAPATGKTTS
jgi:hypothetical protein